MNGRAFALSYDEVHDVNNPTIIAIAGMSASGKTTLAADLASATNGIVIALDNSYVDIKDYGLTAAEVSQVNWDELKAFRLQEFGRHVAQLVVGNAIEQPIYDFTISQATGSHTIKPHPIVILEGQFTFCVPEVIEFCTTKVFIDLPLDEAYNRRVKRDVEERGRCIKSVTEQWENHVLPAWENWVSPSRRLADLELQGKGNRQNNVDQILNHLNAGTALRTASLA